MNLARRGLGQVRDFRLRRATIGEHLPANRRRAVGRAVVDQNQLRRGSDLGEERFQRAAQIARFVVIGYDYRERVDRHRGEPGGHTAKGPWRNAKRPGGARLAATGASSKRTAGRPIPSRNAGNSGGSRPDRSTGLCGRPRPILVQHAHARVADHVQRAGHGIGRHRHAGGQGLQEHQAKGIGPARKHEHVRRGVIFGQFFAMPVADETNLGIFATSAARCGPSPTTYLVPGRPPAGRPRCSSPAQPDRRTSRSAADR